MFGQKADREIGDECAGCFARCQFQSEIVNLGYSDAVPGTPQRTHVFGILDRAKGKNRVIGREARAVMPKNIIPELHGVFFARRINLGEAISEIRDKVEVIVEFVQAAEYYPRDIRVRRCRGREQGIYIANLTDKSFGVFAAPGRNFDLAAPTLPYGERDAGYENQKQKQEEPTLYSCKPTDISFKTR